MTRVGLPAMQGRGTDRLQHHRAVRSAATIRERIVARSVCVLAAALVVGATGLVAGCARTQEAPLPIWATPEELEVAAALPERTPRDYERSVAVAPTGSIRVPAEYERTHTVILTWTHFVDMLEEIAGAAASAGATVWAIGGPPEMDGVPADRYQALDLPFNSVWSRDYGPFGIAEGGALAIVDSTYRWYASRADDDALPCKLASRAGAECFTTPLILDGGNFLTDGHGNLFTTIRTYEWNSAISRDEVDRLIKAYYGVENIFPFDYARDPDFGGPADGTGHIDMFVKLLAPCTVLVARAADAPYAAPLDAAARFFSEFTCAEGRHYDVYRIDGWESDGTWYTYTNSLIVNETVIVPSYEDGDNEVAREIYRRALPGRDVVMVPSDDSIGLGGSIHCISRDIPHVESATTGASPTPGRPGSFGVGATP